MNARPGARKGSAATAGVAAAIPHSRPLLGTDETAAAVAVIETGQLAQGPRVASLEAATALTTGVATAAADAGAHAVAVSSGTAALFVALRSLGVGRGDEVLIPAYVCASLNQAVRFAGARPRFFDSDPVSLNPDPDDAARKLGPRTAACIVPHLFGLPAEISAFMDLGVPVIEDCAQTLGVMLENGPVGSFGTVTVCSFYATKLIAGGEGGMVLSRDRRLVDRARALRDCEQPHGDAEAFNFKMSDLHAAIAEVQLGRLPQLLSRRRKLAAAYRAALAGAAIDLPLQPSVGGHAWFRFVVRLRRHDPGMMIERCEQGGLSCRRPVGRLAEGIDTEDLPGCRSAWTTACSLPLYPSLSDEEAGDVPVRFLAALGCADD